jgi:hypothetical protein
MSGRTAEGSSVLYGCPKMQYRSRQHAVDEGDRYQGHVDDEGGDAYFHPTLPSRYTSSSRNTISRSNWRIPGLKKFSPVVSNTLDTAVSNVEWSQLGTPASIPGL